MNLVISGWGDYAIWDKHESVPVMLAQPKHKFLWALKQKCGEPHECVPANVLNDSSSLMCGIAPSTARNGPFHGDSGGINSSILHIQVYKFFLVNRYSYMKYF